MSQQNNNECTIYGLVDPRTETVFYVGLTFNPKHRLYAHCSPPIESRTYSWVQELKAEKRKPRMIVLEVCTKDYAKREQFWIDWHRNLNSDLLNAFNRAGAGLCPDGRKKATEQLVRYTISLPLDLVPIIERVRKEVGLSNFVADCLRQRYARTSTAAGDALQETSRASEPTRTD